jgi:hypothetical protein
MDAEHMKEFGIEPDMKVIHTGSENTNRKGQDTDIDRYDVFDAAGKLIFKCEVHESMGIYPPHKKSTSYRKSLPEGGAV